MSRAGRFLVRGALVLASATLLAWSAFVLQAYWGQGTLSAAAARIMAGETLRPEAMAGAAANATALTASRLPPPDLLRAAALVRLRAAETDVAAGHGVAGNPAFAAAETTVRAALAAAPTDGALWFALAWLGKARDGYTPAELPLLAASYRTAPREGWLALHRNALAVTLLPALPAELRTAALDEFRGLVASNYIPAAADILAGPGWSQRDLLLAALAPLPDETRAAFARELARRDVAADVPGFAQRRDRPWR